MDNFEENITNIYEICFDILYEVSIYILACSSEFTKVPDISPVLIIPIYIGGKTSG